MRLVGHLDMFFSDFEFDFRSGDVTVDILALYLSFYMLSGTCAAALIYQRFLIGLNLLVVFTNLSLLEILVRFFKNAVLIIFLNNILQAI